jgi:hypothetical protein
MIRPIVRSIIRPVIKGSLFSLGSRAWTPQSLVVEDAAPTHVVMTGMVAETKAVASDFTIAGFTITLLERDATNKILTLTLSTSVAYGEVLNVVIKGKSYAVTNNTAVIAEYTAVYNAQTSKAVGNDIIYQNRWIKDLKDLGILDLAKVVDNFACHNSQASLLNWKSPGTYNPTLNNAPGFTAYTGFKPDLATSKYIKSNFTPSTNGAGFLGQDDISVLIGVSEETVGDNFDFGGPGSSSNKRLLLNSRKTAGFYTTAVNSAAADSDKGSLVSKRYLGATRNSATQAIIYRNKAGYLINSNSSALNDNAVYVGGAAGYGGNNAGISFLIITKALSEEQYQGMVDANERYLSHYATNIIAYQKTTSFNLVTEGHSFLAAAAFLSDIVSLINTTKIHHVAVGGDIISVVVGRADTVDSYFITETPTYKNVLALYIGVNDMDNTVGCGTTTYNALKPYVQARIAAGEKDIFVWTMTPSTNGGRSGQFEIERGVFNNNLRNDLSTLHRVYILDTDTIAELTNCANATYFSDNLHLTPAGALKAASLFTAKLVQLYG